MPVAQLDDLPFAAEPTVGIASLERPRREILALDDLPFAQEQDVAPAAQEERPRRFSLPDFPAMSDEPAKPIEPVRFAPRQTPPPKADEGPKYEGNVVSNFLKEGGELASGIFQLLTTGLPKGLQMIFSNPDQYLADFKQAFGPEAREAIGHELVGRYVDAFKKHGPEGLLAEAHNRPLSTLLDLSMVGEALGVTTKATGALVRTAGAVGTGQKIARVGSAIAKTGRAIDPLANTAKLISKVGAKPLEYLGVGKWTRKMLGLKEAELSAEVQEKLKNLRAIVANKLSDGEAHLLDEAIRVGAPEDLAALRGTAAEDAYRVWREIVDDQEAAITFRPGMLTKEEGDSANAVIAARYLSERTGQKVTTADALAMIRSGQINPTYATLFPKQQKGVRGLIQWLFENEGDYHRIPSGRGKKVGRLERRTGLGDYERDPRIYMARQVDIYHNVNWRLRWYDRVIRELVKSGEIKVVKEADKYTIKSLARQGYEMLPDTINRKYYDTAARAGSVLVDEIRKQLAMQGRIDPGRIRAFMDAVVKSELGKKIGPLKHIAVPRHVARMIAKEFAFPGPWGKIYDTALGYWKAAATIFSPTYWIPVAVSNGFMSVLAGVGLRDFASFIRNRHLLPAQLKAAAEAVLEIPGRNRFQKITQRFGEYAQALDRNLLRGPIFSKVVRETYGELKATGKAFFDASDSLGEFFRRVAASGDELSGVERKIQLLQEQVAQRIPEYRALGRRMARAQTPFESAALQREMSRIQTDVIMRLRESGELARQIPELAKYAEVAEKAIEMGNIFAGNYLRLHPIERVYFRRLVPFYGFTAAMLKLSYRLPFLQPARTFMWNRLAEIVNDAVTDEEQPKWVQRIIPIFTTAKGEIIGIDLNAANPWAGSSKMAEVGGLKVPGIVDLGRQNPLVKLWMDVTGGIPSWSKRPISTGEAATRLDNGQAYVFENGEIRPTIPQSTVPRALWGITPFSRIVDNLLLGQAQTDRGWVFSPDPVRVNGRPVDARPFLTERLPGLFIRTSRANPAEEKKKMKMRIAGVIRSFVDDIRRAPPEKRAAMIEVLKDWMQSENRWRAIQD